MKEKKLDSMGDEKVTKVLERVSQLVGRGGGRVLFF